MKFKHLLLAIRPKTLGAAFAPVLIATALAFRVGKHHWLYAALALLGAFLIQIGTNLANDYYDFLKGADTQERKGPTRVTQAGLMTPQQVKWAFVAAFGLAVAVGIPLLLRGGWPILVVGILSVLSGLLYTWGPYALAYLGLGDIFVLIFFGPVAVGGTYYLQALELPAYVLAVGLAPGFFSMALLAINNLRDIDQDRAANKRTLALRFGERFARGQVLLSLLIPALCPVALWLWSPLASPKILLASAVFLSCLPILRTVFTTREGPPLNGALAHTGQILFLYSLLFFVGWVV